MDYMIRNCTSTNPFCHSHTSNPADEPTSGLDSRGALVVMRAMKRIADTGRTVCATIHQPSAAVFEVNDRAFLFYRLLATT